MSLPPDRLRHALALGLLAAIGAGGLLLRLDRALALAPIFDERLWTGMAEVGRAPGSPWPRHGGDHPLLGVYLLGAGGAVFGRDLTGYRITGVVAGTLTLLLLAGAVSRSAGRAAALTAAALLAVNPLHLAFSARAFQAPFEALLLCAALWALAGLPAAGRGGLLAGAACLGGAFLCNESAALVGLGWLAALALDPERRAGLTRGDLALAAAVFLVVVAPDLAYNLTARAPDFRYVNYLDHLERIARPAATFQGLGFFVRDTLNARVSDVSLWQDVRPEYEGMGDAFGLLLLTGLALSFRRGGDPSGGLWRLPPLLFLLVTSFTQPLAASELDRPNWTWLTPTLPLITAATAYQLVALARGWGLRLPRWPAGGGRA